MSDSIQQTCPLCGGYRLVLHCAHPDCDALWCPRGECGWGEYNTCGYEAGEQHPWALETVEQMPGCGPPQPKRWLRAVIFCGRGIIDDPTDRKHYIAPSYSWQTKHGDQGRADWVVADIEPMRRTIEAVFALPTTEEFTSGRGQREDGMT